MKTRYLPAVKKYIKLLEILPELVKESPVSEKFMYESLEMSPKTWHNRKTLKNWEVEEVLKVLQIIENQALTK
jgi:predicted transcriptional regulator